MKTQCEVLRKVSQLVQSHVATSTDQERFVSAECGESGLIVTAQGEDGIRRQFKIQAEELTNEPPTAICRDAAPATSECSDEPVSAETPPEENENTSQGESSEPVADAAASQA